MVRQRDDAKNLTREQYESLGRIISKEYGHPHTRQDGKHWTVENDFGKFYIDLHQMFGVQYRVTVTSRLI